MEGTRAEPNLHIRLARQEYGFLDLGCGDGGSLTYCEEVFGRGPGLGIDNSEAKVREARERGLPVVLEDVRSVDIPVGCVSFCSMMDFLEHVPPESTASILAGAAKAARDFLFIRHPSFEDIEYLKDRGLKFDWTDWSGHRNMMTQVNLTSTIEALGYPQYVVVPRKQILDTTHQSVVPMSAPTDTVGYDEATHGDKPFTVFNRPIWQQFDIVVRLDGLASDSDWQDVIQVPLRLSKQV